MGSVFSKYLCNQKAAALSAREVDGGGRARASKDVERGQPHQWSSSALGEENRSGEGNAYPAVNNGYEGAIVTFHICVFCFF